MATFTAIKGRGKGSGAMGGVMQYVQQKKKTLWEGQQLVTGYVSFGTSQNADFPVH